MFSTSAATVPIDNTVNLNGQFVYVVNSGATSVAGFTISIGGFLAVTTPTTFSTALNVSTGITTPGRP